jgi:dolichol-phosphate mannosyltransferase
MDDKMEIHDSLISIIIPVFNEEGNVRLIAQKLLQQMHGEKFEILFVDDGSGDSTLNALRALSAHPSVRYLSFSRNFGHQNALEAGFDFAEGTCVITMDGDLQHPVELLPQMIAMWRAGADVVHTKRKRTVHPSWFKKLSSSCYYKVFSLCATVPIEHGTADFRLLDRKIVDLCKKAGDDIFFWRGFIPWLGFRQEFIEFEPHARAHGVSKYNLKKMARLAWTGISSFSLLPLRIASVLGILGLFAALLYFFYFIWLNIYAVQTVPGWSSLMVVLLFFGAIQLISLGVLGEYVGKIYVTTKRRTNYVLRETKKKKKLKLDGNDD